eukprot:scaffold853_cov57-Phaeocystis_antarctica.AAC.5
MARRQSFTGPAMSQGRTLKEGQYVWVTVETHNEVKSQELILPAAECFHPHPGEDVADHCQLMFLSQPTMLENTRATGSDSSSRQRQSRPPTHKRRPPAHSGQPSGLQARAAAAWAPQRSPGAPPRRPPRHPARRCV